MTLIRLVFWFVKRYNNSDKSLDKTNVNSDSEGSTQDKNETLELKLKFTV